MLPADPKDRARARWFEEFADTRLGDVFIWGFFYPKVVHPLVWGEPGDEERVARTLEKDIPAVVDYLERELPASGYLFDEIGLADIAIASMFRNAAYAGFEPDADRWPRTAAFVGHVLKHPAIASLLPFEDVQRGVEIRRRRQALLDAGAPLTDETHGHARAAPGRHAALACRTPISRRRQSPGAFVRTQLARRGCREIQCSRRVRSDRFEGM